ncbi:hypothetical protein MCP1_230018 [Candidatus Terasakiella magnetica]|nr:hypothetical protein MCP1_230018 [Candidatus Terasakiella magnetica]
MRQRIYSFKVMAEGAGFEPALRFDTLGRFSKPLVSATHPPLRRGGCLPPWLERCF